MGMNNKVLVVFLLLVFGFHAVSSVLKANNEAVNSRVESLAEALGYEWVETKNMGCMSGSNVDIGCYPTGYTNDKLLIEYFNELNCPNNWDIKPIAQRCREIEKLK